MYINQSVISNIENPQGFNKIVLDYYRMYETFVDNRKSRGIDMDTKLILDNINYAKFSDIFREYINGAAYSTNIGTKCINIDLAKSILGSVEITGCFIKCTILDSHHNYSILFPVEVECNDDEPDVNLESITPHLDQIKVNYKIRLLREYKLVEIKPVLLWLPDSFEWK